MQAPSRFPDKLRHKPPAKRPVWDIQGPQIGCRGRAEGGAGKTGRPSCISAVRTSVPAAVHFTIEKEVGCKNALLNELIRAPFCSLWLRFSCHSGSARKAVHFCSRSAIEFQCNM